MYKGYNEKKYLNAFSQCSEMQKYNETWYLHKH